jgi:hypothetical protein
MFQSHRTIIRQLNIGIRLVIELLVWIHASVTHLVYKVTELPQVFFFMGWNLHHQVLRPLLAYCTAPDDR